MAEVALDDILSGKDPEPQPRGEDGRFISASQEEEAAPPAAPAEPTPQPQVEVPPTPAAPVVEPPPVEDRVPQAALLDERRKRQDRERELQDLRDELERLKKPIETPAEYYDNPMAAIEAARKRAVEEAESRMTERMAAQQAAISERFARRQWSDYDKKREAFVTRYGSDPVLQAETQRHVNEGGDLGEFIYKTATSLEQFQQAQALGGIDALVEKRVQEELAKRTQAQAAVPQSLNSQGSPATSTETWSEPPLEQILKRK